MVPPDVPDGLCLRCLGSFAFGCDPLASPALPASLATLGSFGDYELAEEIARGGMGVVYRARQRSLDREVAVKLLRDGVLAGPEEAERLRAEAGAAAALHHPGIVAIHEIGEHEGQPFFSMEFIAGQNLAELTRTGPLPARRAAELVAAVADAVQHAHDRGVLHRDLKPSNVIVDLAGRPHVADFGLARRVHLDSHLTLSGQVIGTPGYLAPEQAAGRSRDVTPASDTYSLGALLYHLLTARAPFVGETPAAVLRQVEEQEPVSPRLLNPGVPRDLETLVLKALAKGPARRYATARELAAELGRQLRGEPILARPVSPAGRAWRWARRNRLVASLGTVAGGLLVAVAAVSLMANVRLTQQRRQAEQVKQFLTTVLAAPDPTKDGREVRVLDLLGRASRRAAAELAPQPLVLAEIQGTLGGTYYQLSLYPEAEPLLRAALGIYERELGPDAIRTAEARVNLGALLHWASRTEESIRELRSAVATLRRHQPAAHRELAAGLGELGSILGVAGQPAEAAQILQEAVELCHDLGSALDPVLGGALGDLSTALSALGRRQESLAALEQAVVLNRRLPDGEVNLATCLSNLADWQARLGNPGGAEAPAREALAIRERLFGTNSSPVAFAHARLGQVLIAATNLPRAEQHVRRALEIGRTSMTARHRNLQFLLRQSGTLHLRAGRPEVAAPELREAHAIAAENYGGGHAATRYNGCLLAEALAALGRNREARDLLAASIGVAQEDLAADPDLPTLQERHRTLSTLLADLNRRLGEL